jgi:hypothetical protein
VTPEFLVDPERGYSNPGLYQAIRDLERREQDLEKRVLALEKQTNSWTGGFLAIASFGAILTFLAAFWDKITGGRQH